LSGAWCWRAWCRLRPERQRHRRQRGQYHERRQRRQPCAVQKNTKSFANHSIPGMTKLTANGRQATRIKRSRRATADGRRFTQMRRPRMILARMQSLNIRRLHRLRRFRSDVVLCHGGKDTVCSRRFCEFLRSLRLFAAIPDWKSSPIRRRAHSPFRNIGPAGFEPTIRQVSFH
jgi:hypothetical protein